MNNLAEANIEQALKGISIPPQPQLLVDLQMEMAMDAQLSKISDIICKDIGISGSVLKIVNSPFFGLRNNITSIKQALSLLGLNNVVNIVNALAIRNSLSFSDLTAMTKIWDNSMDVAMAAAALGKMLGVCSPDEAYSLGLFHNSGIHLLMSKSPNYLAGLNKAYSQGKQRITEVENTLFASNHAVIGYYIAKTWKLPSYLSEAIADHHRSDEIFADHNAGADKKKNLLAVLKIAENTCKTYQTFGNHSVDFEFERIKSDLLLYLGLSDYDLTNLQAEVLDLGLG